MQGRGVEAEDAVRAGAAEDGGHTHQEVGAPLLTRMKCPLSNAQWASPFTVAWTEPFVQIYTKFAKIFNHI